MKRVFSHLCFILLLLAILFSQPAHAIPISGNRMWGSFVGSITYTYNAMSEDATLEVMLTNNSPTANGGYLTGFALNNPGGKIQGVALGDTVFVVLGVPCFDNHVNAMPFGYFDIGAALGGSWQGGGDPKRGIGVGDTKTFDFRLTGENLQTLDELSFVNELSDRGISFFVVRFRGFQNGESDKVPAGEPLPVTLSSFSAISRGEYIEVSWTSQTELDALAYHLLRSEKANGQFVEIARLKAHGNSETPHDYRYVDKDVVTGRTYYYNLVEEDYEGNMRRHGPVFAAAGTTTPGAYSLLPNYPNPFNLSTAIGYQIPQAGQVTLIIYNVLGQEVRSMVDAHQEAGSYTVMWDGKDNHGHYLNSGVYFYTLRAGDFTETQKMVLTR